MALTIEDGSGVAGANSYISVVDAQAYADARGLSVVLTEAMLIKAMDYIEAKRAQFQGTKTSSDYPLQWPRSGVWLDGFELDSDEIPDVLWAAQAQLACDIAGGTALMPIGLGQEVISIKVEGAIEKHFQPGAGTNPQPQLTAAEALLAPLLRTATSARFVTVRA